MNNKFLFIAIGLLIGTFHNIAFSQNQVQVWEEPITIPTYLINEPEKAPMFYNGRAYQGAEGHIYPYPFHDELTDKRVKKEYNAVYLENEFIKLCVLPEIGGRILYARDKTNDYDFIYHQHVIKPALIGMLGAWISGGIEWDLPHHHRARVFEPVDYKIEENEDGSKTLWVGELELRHRMRWVIGLTLYPDKSYFEAEVKIFNRTQVANSILAWANVGVHTNKNYQVIFPPSTDYVTYHSKNQFTTWPETNDIWRGIDYTKGVDLSWWKNHPSPSSFFAWNYENDFFGGYDHGKEAGIAYVANHHVAPGKKFFLWGPGFGEDTHGDMWNKILTEDDGPYLELMAGGYSDNQPDYSWIQPYEMKTYKWHWYPIREIDGMKKANLHGALNIEAVSEDSLMIAANATTLYEGAQLVLSRDGRKVMEEKITLTPNQPFRTTIAHSAELLKGDYTLSLHLADGTELVSYCHSAKEKKKKIPDPLDPPKAPQNIETVEELYLTGLRIEQFHNPSLEPYPYYEEALKHDPGNYRVNRSLGIFYYKRGMMEKAKKHLETAVKRITRKYTKPRDGEAHYYLGIIEKYLGHYQKAYDNLYKATWDYRFSAPAYYQLAQIDCIRRDFPSALDHINSSLDANRNNYKAYGLKASVLRQMERYIEAENILKLALEKDPLHPWAGYEMYLSALNDGSADAKKRLDQLNNLLQANKNQSYLELATNYMNCGLWKDAHQVLSTFVDLKNPDSPMIYYYLGYISDKLGQEKQMRRYYDQANSASPAYCFPFRLESVKVLNHAIEMQPQDDRGHYYLGNLLFYYKQENKAIESWEKSASLNDDYSYVLRNLGMAYERIQNNPEKAISYYKQAIEANSTDSRFFAELTTLYRKADSPFKERLQMLENHEQMIKQRDDALSLLIQTWLQVGRYDEAINYLSSHHFRRWEGGGDIRDIYVNAYLLRGLERYKKGAYNQALKDFTQALKYPDNIEAAESYHGGRQAQIHWFIGRAYEAMNKKDKAESHFKQAVSAKKRGEGREIHYYEARALQKLGMKERAHQIFLNIIQNGKDRLNQTTSMSFFAKFGEQQSADVQKANAHYLIGLGYYGVGNNEKAGIEFQQTLELDIDHIWARHFLEIMNHK